MSSEPQSAGIDHVNVSELDIDAMLSATQSMASDLSNRVGHKKPSKKKKKKKNKKKKDKNVDIVEVHNEDLNLGDETKLDTVVVNVDTSPQANDEESIPVNIVGKSIVENAETKTVEVNELHRAYLKNETPIELGEDHSPNDKTIVDNNLAQHDGNNDTQPLSVDFEKEPAIESKQPADYINTDAKPLEIEKLDDNKVSKNNLDPEEINQTNNVQTSEKVNDDKIEQDGVQKKNSLDLTLDTSKTEPQSQVANTDNKSTLHYDSDVQNTLNSKPEISVNKEKLEDFDQDSDDNDGSVSVGASLASLKSVSLQTPESADERSISTSPIKMSSSKGFQNLTMLMASENPTTDERSSINASSAEPATSFEESESMSLEAGTSAKETSSKSDDEPKLVDKVSEKEPKVDKVDSKTENETTTPSEPIIENDKTTGTNAEAENSVVNADKEDSEGIEDSIVTQETNENVEKQNVEKEKEGEKEKEKEEAEEENNMDSLDNTEVFSPNDTKETEKKLESDLSTEGDVGEIKNDLLPKNKQSESDLTTEDNAEETKEDLVIENVAPSEKENLKEKKSKDTNEDIEEIQEESKEDSAEVAQDSDLKETFENEKIKELPENEVKKESVYTEDQLHETKIETDLKTEAEFDETKETNDGSEENKKDSIHETKHNEKDDEINQTEEKAAEKSDKESDQETTDNEISQTEEKAAEKSAEKSDKESDQETDEAKDIIIENEEKQPSVVSEVSEHSDAADKDKDVTDVSEVPYSVTEDSDEVKEEIAQSHQVSEENEEENNDNAETSDEEKEQLDKDDPEKDIVNPELGKTESEEDVEETEENMKEKNDDSIIQDTTEGLSFVDHDDTTAAADTSDAKTVTNSALDDLFAETDAFLKELDFIDDSELNSILKDLDNVKPKTKQAVTISKETETTDTKNKVIKTSAIAELNMKEPVYIYTSLAGGGFHMIPRTNRLATILTANRIEFTYRDLGTDDLARKVWRTYGKGRSLPAVVRGRDDIIGNWEEVDELNEDYRLYSAIYESI